MKVLVFVSTLSSGGVANVVINQVRACRDIDSSIVFDIATNDGHSYPERLQALFGSFYHVDRFSKSPILYRKEVREVIVKSGCDAVHVHLGHLSWIICQAAKELGVSSRVIQSHSELPRSNSLPFRLAMKIAPLLNQRYSTTRFAVSEGAGKAYFSGDFTFLPNIVDISRIPLDRAVVKESYDEEFSIDSEKSLILGFAGLLDINKRPEIAIKVAERLNAMGIDCHLLIAGSGPRLSELTELTSGSEICTVLGQRNDAIELFSYIDVLLVPSIVEGMSLSILEAQLSGTACVVSDTIPSSNDLGLGSYRSASCDDIDSWAAAVIAFGKRSVLDNLSLADRLKALEAIGYDDRSVARALLNAFSGN